MVHKILMWISVIATILGTIMALVEKLGIVLNNPIPLNYIYVIIIFGICFSLILAITENKTKINNPSEKISATSSTGDINIISASQTKGNLTIGDSTTSAGKRYDSAYELVEDELISNFINLSVLIDGIESDKPEKFWDLRKPNESEDTYQERAKSFHRDYQNSVFQMIHNFPITKDVYNSHKLNLSNNINSASEIKKIYQYQEQLLEDLQSYSNGLLHNLSLNYHDSDLVAKNLSLQSEAIINAWICFLNAMSHFVEAYPNIGKKTLQVMGMKFKSNSFVDIRKEINIKIKKLYKEKSKVLGERIKKPQRDEEINRIINDPYLLMLRKTVGLSNMLTESEAWALKHKKIQKSITESSDLLSAAAFSYLESDARATKYYFEKVLKNNDYSTVMKLFIEKSLDRINYPDKFDGSIGLIILELAEESVLKQKGISVGAILYKLNGEIINDPSDVSSTIANTNKDDNCLLEFYTLEGNLRRVAVPGSCPICCKISQLIMLKSFQV